MGCGFDDLIRLMGSIFSEIIEKPQKRVGRQRVISYSEAVDLWGKMWVTLAAGTFENNHEKRREGGKKPGA